MQRFEGRKSFAERERDEQHSTYLQDSPAYVSASLSDDSGRVCSVWCTALRESVVAVEAHLLGM